MATEPEITQFEQLSHLVETNFTTEESLLEHGIPTFYVRLEPNSKQAFLQLYDQLGPMGLVPLFKKHDSRFVLQVIPKPPITQTRRTLNIILLLATIVTLTITGYLLSLGWTQQDPFAGAAMFTTGMMAILGAHEMAHKIAANKHNVEATYPYFIPGIPPLGTFGAVIQQKSLAPNRDALFDLGLSGPVTGFMMTIFVTIIGVQLSQLTFIPPPNASFIQVPLLFDFIVTVFPPSGEGSIILLHPVAYAGYIGMVVTMLNLLPAGMLDGGHVTKVLLGDRARIIISYVAILGMIIIGAWLMAILVFFMSRYPHPGSLDDISKLSTRRKLAAIVLVAIFVLSVAPLYNL